MSVDYSSLILGLMGGSVPTTLLWLLGRKGANRKLELEEQTSDANVFTTQRDTYQDLLDRADKATKAHEDAAKTAQAAADLALSEAKSSKEALEELTKTVRDQGYKMETLRNLFQRVLTRANVVLTPEEQEIFDETHSVRD